MKKRALILAMIAFIAATTSEPSINMVRAEETQVEETQTEENAGQTSELLMKKLILMLPRQSFLILTDMQ